MELTLKEKFVILAYDPVKGHNLASNYIGFGIGGAILLSLQAPARVDLKMAFCDNQRSGYP